LRGKAKTRADINRAGPAGVHGLRSRAGESSRAARAAHRRVREMNVNP